MLDKTLLNSLCKRINNRFLERDLPVSLSAKQVLSVIDRLEQRSIKVTIDNIRAILIDSEENIRKDIKELQEAGIIDKKLQLRKGIM